MSILLYVVNTDSTKSVDALFQFFTTFLFSAWGMAALAAFVGLVIVTVWFDPPKWIWLTLAIYMSALGYSTSPYLDNHLAFPLEQIRPLNRTISTGMLILLLIPTFKSSRGWRSKLILGGTFFFFVFEMVFSTRFVVGAGRSRGLMGFAMYPLIYAALAIGVSRWLETTHDVHKLLRCVLVAASLMALGTIYQLIVRRAAVIDNGRLLGTTNNPQHLGTSMAFTLPVACFFLLRKNERVLWRLIAAALGGSAAIFIAWTQSRAGLLIGLTALLIYFRTRLGKATVSIAAIALMFAVIVGAFGFTLPGTDRLFSTVDSRSGVWATLWRKFLVNPVLGSGDEADAAESSYLSSLSQFGMIGSIPFLIALLLMARDFVRLYLRRKSLGELAELADLVLACAGSMLFLGCFESYLLGAVTDYLFCFYIFLAIGSYLLDPALVWSLSAAQGSVGSAGAEWESAYPWITTGTYDDGYAGELPPVDSALEEHLYGDFT